MVLTSRRWNSSEATRDIQDPETEIRDIDISSASPEAIITFLEQFYKINTRWFNWYEQSTESSSTGKQTFRGGYTHRACPPRIWNVPQDQGHRRHMGILLGDFIFPGARAAAGSKICTGADYNPSTDTSKYDDTFLACTSTDRKDDSQLSLMIQDIVRITQALILRSNPADVPIIFCTLCILKLISEYWSRATHRRYLWRIRKQAELRLGNAL